MFFYLSLVISAILLGSFMIFATYDYNRITSSYYISLQQNEDKFNSDVEWIGNKATTIFDHSIAYESALIV